MHDHDDLMPYYARTEEGRVFKTSQIIEKFSEIQDKLASEFEQAEIAAKAELEKLMSTGSKEVEE